MSKLSSFIDFTLENILKKNKIENLENLLFYDPLIPLDKKRWQIYLKKIIEYKKNKLIKNIGFSVYNKFEVKNILQEFKPDILQFPYNVFDQSFGDQDYLRKLKKHKISLQARSIFLQGLLCSKNLKKKF